MRYLMRVEKGTAVANLPPLSATEARQRLERAEAYGLAVRCTDSDGKLVSNEQLRAAAALARET